MRQFHSIGTHNVQRIPLPVELMVLNLSIAITALPDFKPCSYDKHKFRLNDYHFHI